MSFVENIVQAVVAKFSTQGSKVKVSRLSSDWKAAEKCFDEFLKGSVLLGLNEFDGIPEGYGNLLLFSNSKSPKEIASQLEVGGKWMWISSSISSIVVKDDEIFPTQKRSELITQTNLHIGKTVVAFRIWEPLPHLAIEFSDGSVLVIHGDNEQCESWAFDNSHPSIGVYALPDGPIAVG
jgi:hypothetical protein